MKIAFLTPEYPHPRLGAAGGIGTGIFNLCNGLIAEGHEPVILVYGQDRDEYFEEAGIHFYRIRNVRFRGISWLLTRKKLQRLIDSLHAKKIIDIVEAPDWTGISAFINTRGPIVVRLNGSDAYFCHLDNRKAGRFNSFLEKTALIQADGLISVSEFTARTTNTVFGLDLRFEIIPNAVEPAKFVPSQDPPDPNTILYFGTLIRKKGLLELPLIFNEVIERIPNAKLILAGRDAGDVLTGTSSTWDLMKPFFSQRALANVSYIGPVAYHLVAGLVARASVCVFPTFAEALPLSWLEAMAMEKAVVASNVGWATEIIEDGTSGFLAHPSDHKRFAAKISALLEDEKLRLETGRGARARILENFDNRQAARRSVEFYSRFI